ncbi:MAG TPA: hypothetical protein VLH58_08915 [Candidatus Methylomirabilis sp.]|nr:hypothetical protein [Candidatus Methylomirabilis sp.]HSC71460.1 hypothetical protein [Candidatus Methylomirabilis sp.]
MEMAIADLVRSLENDLASFYARIKGLSRFEESKRLFQIMEEQCRQHAQSAEEISRRHPVPGDLNLAGIIEVQARIMRTLFHEIIQEPDLLIVYRKLADGEETISLLYRRIAEHFRSLSPDHQPAAEEFDRLADEEMTHRDAILKLAENRRREKEG